MGIHTVDYRGNLNSKAANGRVEQPLYRAEALSVNTKVGATSKGTRVVLPYNDR